MRLSFAATVVITQVIPSLSWEYLVPVKDLSHGNSQEPKSIVAGGEEATYLRIRPKNSTVRKIPTIDNFVLKNKRSSGTYATKKECLLTSHDVDVGILSCGEGRYCQESAESKLGGLCSDIRRKAITLSNLTHCDSSCTCTASTKSPSGYIRCPYIPTYAKNASGCVYCGNARVCATSMVLETYANSIQTAYQVCYYITQPYKKTVCVYQNSSTGIGTGKSCTYKINNATCNSCNRSSNVDCTNIGGMKGRFATIAMRDYNYSNSNKCNSTSPFAPPANPPGYGGLISNLFYCNKNCTCTANTTSTTGYIGCGYHPAKAKNDSGCVYCDNTQVCINSYVNETYTNGVITATKQCYYLTQPYNKTVCLYQTTSTGFGAKHGCIYKINGSTCKSCNHSYYVDCTNIGGLKGKYGTKALGKYHFYNISTSSFYVDQCNSTRPVAPPTGPPPPPTSPISAPTGPLPLSTQPPIKGGGGNKKGVVKGGKLSTSTNKPPKGFKKGKN